MKDLKIKPNYLFIPLTVLLVAVIGGYFTGLGMDWYNTDLIKPALTPPRWAFPIAWNIIFVLCVIAAIMLWNRGEEDTKFLWFFIRPAEQKRYNFVIGLLILNAILNVGWSILFFGLQLILAAFIEMIILEITIILLIIFGWKISRPASLLFIPYALWVAFATYLTGVILYIN